MAKGVKFPLPHHTIEPDCANDILADPLPRTKLFSTSYQPVVLFVVLKSSTLSIICMKVWWDPFSVAGFAIAYGERLGSALGFCPWLLLYKTQCLGCEMVSRSLLSVGETVESNHVPALVKRLLLVDPFLD